MGVWAAGRRRARYAAIVHCSRVRGDERLRAFATIRGRMEGGGIRRRRAVDMAVGSVEVFSKSLKLLNLECCEAEGGLSTVTARVPAACASANSLRPFSPLPTTPHPTQKTRILPREGRPVHERRKLTHGQELRDPPGLPTWTPVVLRSRLLSRRLRPH